MSNTKHKPAYFDFNPLGPRGQIWDTYVPCVNEFTRVSTLTATWDYSASLAKLQPTFLGDLCTLILLPFQRINRIKLHFFGTCSTPAYAETTRSTYAIRRSRAVLQTQQVSLLQAFQLHNHYSTYQVAMLVEPLSFVRDPVAALSSSANNYAPQVQALTDFNSVVLFAV